MRLTSLSLEQLCEDSCVQNLTGPALKQLTLSPHYGDWQEKQSQLVLANAKTCKFHLPVNFLSLQMKTIIVLILKKSSSHLTKDTHQALDSGLGTHEVFKCKFINM